MVSLRSGPYCNPDPSPLTNPLPFKGKGVKFKIAKNKDAFTMTPVMILLRLISVLDRPKESVPHPAYSTTTNTISNNNYPGKTACLEMSAL
jgi:hypothetical protein